MDSSWLRPTVRVLFGRRVEQWDNFGKSIALHRSVPADMLQSLPMLASSYFQETNSRAVTGEVQVKIFYNNF